MKEIVDHFLWMLACRVPFPFSNKGNDLGTWQFWDWKTPGIKSFDHTLTGSGGGRKEAQRVYILDILERSKGNNICQIARLPFGTQSLLAEVVPKPKKRELYN